MKKLGIGILTLALLVSGCGNETASSNKKAFRKKKEQRY